MLKKIYRKIIKKQSTVSWGYPIEASEWDKETIQLSLRFSMTSPQRIWALIQSVKYVVQNNLDGDFVECGVWRGGSVLAIARTLENLGISNKRIYLFDTFEGMTKPTTKDKRSSDKLSAVDLLNREPRNTEHGRKSVWAIATEEDVKNTLSLSNFPKSNFIFVKGDVLDTLDQTSVNKISLLRLDTDWYESTLHELKSLYPKVVANGILIIDDYGYWEGCRIAVHEFVESLSFKPLIHYIDSSGRLLIKN
jgi:hypothetical protein